MDSPKLPTDQIAIGYVIVFGASKYDTETGIKSSYSTGSWLWSTQATSDDDATGKAYTKALKLYPHSDGYTGHWGICPNTVHMKREWLDYMAKYGAAAPVVG